MSGGNQPHWDLTDMNELSSMFNELECTSNNNNNHRLFMVGSDKENYSDLNNTKSTIMTKNDTVASKKRSKKLK